MCMCPVVPWLGEQAQLGAEESDWVVDVWLRPGGPERREREALPRPRRPDPARLE